MEKGFTEKIIPILQPYKVLVYDKTYHYYARVASKDLLKIVPLLPKENLKIRQNKSPRVQDFIEVAKMEPRALFSLYIISQEREDERVTIEAVSFPVEREDVAKFLLKKALHKPDDDYVFPFPEGKYRFMWWD